MWPQTKHNLDTLNRAEETVILGPHDPNPTLTRTVSLTLTLGLTIVMWQVYLDISLSEAKGIASHVSAKIAGNKNQVCDCFSVKGKAWLYSFRYL